MKSTLSLIATLASPLFLLQLCSCSPAPERPNAEDIFKIPEVEDEGHRFADVVPLIEAYSDFVTSVTKTRELMLAPSVKMTVVELTTTRTLPLRMCVMEADLSDAALSMEVTFPEITYPNWPVRNMVKQAEAIDAPGHRVIGAVNADFFDMGGTGYPLGGVYHQGKVIKSDFSNTSATASFFGTDKSGKLIMGGYGDYVNLDKSLIYELVGSHYVLVRNGDVQWFSEDYKAPRTAVGADKSGYVLFLVVIDELEPNTPRDGINFRDLAMCMKQIGCWNSVNMDGGGSSTFVYREDDKFKTANKKEGAYLRPVADGVAIVSVN